MSWSMEYPLGLEKYQETDEYLPIPPPGSSVGRPLEFDRAINKDAPRTAPAGDQACDGTATPAAPSTVSVTSTERAVATVSYTHLTLPTKRIV